MTLKKTLEEMQGGLLLTMDAVKKDNTQEAERLLLIVGGLLDRALRAGCKISRKSNVSDLSRSKALQNR